MQPRPRAETSRSLLPSWRFCIVSPDVWLTPGDSGPHHDFDRLALVHPPVAVGNLLEADDPVEDAAGLDPSLQDIGEQLLDVRADRGGAAADRDVVVERRLRGGNRLVMGDTDTSHGATRTGDTDRGADGLVGAD